MRPFKVLKRGREGGDSDSYRKKWDAVWVSPREVIGEGILVSKRVSLGGGGCFSDCVVLSNPCVCQKGGACLGGEEGVCFSVCAIHSKSGCGQEAGAPPPVILTPEKKGWLVCAQG